jgi:predicted NBD/HSP70 family sugar kinase
MSARRAIDLRRNNSAAILRLLLDEGPLPRVDIAAKLSLSTGAVTRITAEMAEHRLLVELEPIASSDAGRRPVPVDINADAFAIAGVHIGLELTTSGLVNLRGRMIGEPHVVEHGLLDARGAIDAASVASQQLAESIEGATVLLGTGVISGGFATQDWQVMADDAVFGWQGDNMTELAEAHGPPNCVIDNAYRAHSRAEMWFGAARNSTNFIEFFVGNLIGAAVVINGEFYAGEGRAPNIAHLPVSQQSEIDCSCGRAGCLASVAGRDATVARARRAGLDATTISEVATAALQGSAVAREVILHRIRAIGEAIAILMDIYDPEKVVLAGSIRLFDDHVSQIRSVVFADDAIGSVDMGKTLDRFDPLQAVVPTTLGDSATANIVAAATARLSEIYRDPLDAVAMFASDRETV